MTQYCPAVRRGERLADDLLWYPAMNDEEDIAQILDDALARIQAERDPAQRAERLRDLARYFEHRRGDPARALTALIAAYREQPRRAAWEKLERLAEAAGAWGELLPELRASLDELAPAERADARLHLEGVLRAQGREPELLRLLEERSNDASELEGRALRLEVAALYARLGDRHEAISRYEELRLDTPGDLAILRALEVLYVEEHRVRELLEVLEAQAGLLEGARDLAPLYRRMAAEWEEQLGARAKAEECLELALSFDPQCKESYRALERLYAADGNWRAAVDIYCRHAAVAPPEERAELHAEVARICERQLGDVAGAIEYYRKLEADRPGALDTMSAPIRLYYTTEDFEQVVSLLERRAQRSRGADRAALYHQAAELTHAQLQDHDRAEAHLARALEADGAHLPSMILLAEVYRDQGRLLSAAKLLREARALAPDRIERTRLLVLEADARRAVGELDRAMELYTAALEAHPEHVLAAECLAALLEQTGRLVEMRGPLAMLASKAADEPSRVAHLLRLARVEERLGEPDRALAALERAVAEAPGELAAQHAHASFLLEHGRHADAHAALSHVVERACELAQPEQLALHHQLGCAARALSRANEAQQHFARALGLDPDHRPSRRALIELDLEGPSALLDHHRALLRTAPPDEQRALHAAIGDLYAGPLDDAPAALDAYRAALALAPEDHRVLHRCLDVCVQEHAWSDALAWLERLIALERVEPVRAKYLLAAGMICRDELARPVDAERFLSAALGVDPTLDRAAEPLEELWSARGDFTALANLHRLRLERLGPAGADDHDGLRARLWSKLGELCLKQGDRESALAALKVAARFDPENVPLGRLLAALYVQAGPDQLDHAIAEHQRVIAAEPDALESYAALEQLYRRVGRRACSLRCREAVAFLERRRDVAAVPDLSELSELELELEEEGAAPDETLLALSPAPLTAELWTRLSHPREDRFLSALFAHLAPMVATAHAQTWAQLGVSRRDRADDGDPRAFARALSWVARAFALPRPDTFVRYSDDAPARLVIAVEQQRLAPTLLVGKPLNGHRRSERALVFHLAQRMAYLRSGRIVRLIAAPGELAQLVDAAMALGDDQPRAPGGTIAALAARLRATLEPLALNQVTTIGQCLRARGVESGEAVLAWMRAADLSAARAALLLVGDLALAARLAEVEPGEHALSADERVLDLVAASVSESMLAAREQLRLQPRAAARPRPPQPTAMT
jgi:tetratricopeptide (TPR) repeat protein